MKLVLAAVAALFLSFSAYGQAVPAPSPFTPKGTAVPTPPPPTTQRGVVVISSRPTIPNQDTGYHVFVGDQGYRANGMGPKTAGIYDVEVYPATNLIIVHEYHLGGVKGDPDVQHRLQIVSPYHSGPPQAEFTKFTTDGRRLLVYYISGMKSEIHALAVDRTTGTESWFTTTVPPGIDVSKFGMGIYDFLVTPNKDGSKTLNVYVIQRDGAVVVYSLLINQIEVIQSGKS